MIKFLTKASLLVAIISTSSLSNERVENILEKMTLREKAGQMILVYNSPVKFLKEHGIGGVLIMQNMLKKPERLKTNIANAQKTLKIPIIVSIDQEGGSVNRLSYLPQWKKTPSAKDMKTWPLDSITRYNDKIAKALVYLGINMNLAPVLDPTVNYLDEKTFISQKKRSFGTGAKEIVPPALAFTKAFTQNNITCVSKHFPGYDSDVNSDYKIATSNADSIDVIKNIAPFKEMRDVYDALMMTSIHYRAFCVEPAVFCKKMVDIARETAPGAIIMTDDLWGTALRSYTYPGKEIHAVSYPDTAFSRVIEYTIKAGNDMLMITYPKKVPLMINEIVRIVKDDNSILRHVNEAVRRILLLKVKMGLL